MGVGRWMEGTRQREARTPQEAGKASRAFPYSFQGRDAVFISVNWRQKWNAGVGRGAGGPGRRSVLQQLRGLHQFVRSGAWATSPHFGPTSCLHNRKAEGSQCRAASHPELCKQRPQSAELQPDSLPPFFPEQTGKLRWRALGCFVGRWGGG